MIKKLLSFSAILLFSFTAVYAQLTVTGNNNGNNLAQILAGNGVTVTNVNLNCAANACGTYTSVATPLNLSTGIMLTSGQVANAVGPNNAPSVGTANGTAGDVDLDALATPNSSQDACVLEFDVVPIGNNMSFSYVMGSEEYPEYVCSNFNDVFAFFISGPNPGGGSYANNNIALIPSTGLHVAINTVNPGVAGANSGGGTCTSLAYSAYYHDNTNGAQVQYDGWTSVFTAQANVIPCQTYHLKLAIADVGDGAYDSGVFLEGNSFVSNGTSVTAAVVNPGYQSTFEGCVNGTFTITLPAAATSNTTVNYTLSGTANNGTDYTSLPGSAIIPIGGTSATVNLIPTQDGLTEGQETVTLSILNPCDGTVYSTATLNINDDPITTASANPNPVCPNATTTLTVSGGVAGNTYSWSPTLGVINPTAASTTATVSSTQTYTVTVTTGTCTASNSVTVTVQPSPSVLASVTPNTDVCVGTTVQLDAAATGGTPGYTYGWSVGTSNGTISNPTATPGATTTYTVTVTDQSTCTATASVTVVAVIGPVVSIGTDQNLCANQSPYVLTVAGGPYQTYLWSDGSTNPTLSVTNDGTFSVTVNNGVCDAISNTVNIHFYSITYPTLADTGMCPGELVTLAADAGFTNVIWNTGATTNSISVSANGTFYYTALDLNGCPTASDTATVTLANPPVVNATASPDTICLGANSVLSSGAASGLNYLWTPTNETTSSITVNTAGIYIIEVTDAFCSSRDTVEVFQYPTVPVTLNNDTSVCVVSTMTIVTNPSDFVSYLWNTNETTSSIDVNAIGNYWVTVNDGNCSYNSDTFTLSLFPPSTAALPDTGFCIGGSITLQAQNGFTNIVWSNGNQGTSILVDVAGDYSYTATDANGCSVVSDTSTVSVGTPPIVNATASPDTICAQGGSSTLSSGALSGLNYLWSPNGEITSTITVTTAGIYIVSVSDNFCPSLDTVTVYEFPYSAPVVSNDISVCLGDSATVSVSGNWVSYVWNTTETTSTIVAHNVGDYWVVVNDGNCTYTSDTFTLSNFPVTTLHAYDDTTLCVGQTVDLNSEPGLDFVTWNTGSNSFTISVTTSGAYSYTSTDFNGCPAKSDTAFVNFVNPPAVNATALPDTIFCPGGTALLNSGAVSGLSYLWLPTNEVTSSITVSAAGIYIVQISAGSCTSLDTVEVFQKTHAPVVLHNDTTVCSGTAITLLPSGAPYFSSSWSTNATTPSISVTAAGNYSVTVSDGNCIYVSDTFTLSNFASTNAQAHNDTTVCAGQQVNINADAGLSNIVWNNTSTGIIISVNDTGYYYYTATDANGCAVSSDSAFVTNTPYPTPVITATPPSICVGQSASTLDAGSVAGTGYVWSLGGATTNTILVSAAGTYSVTATLSNCSASASINIVAANIPLIQLQPVVSCCQAVVLNPAPGSGYTYLWSDASTDSTLTISTTNNLSEVYSVTATNAFGCTATASDTVTIKCINASASSVPDTIIYQDSTRLNVNTDYLNGLSYIWTPTSGLSNSNVANPMASPAEQTTYTVIVRDDEFGCLDTAETVVYVVYPNVVSVPNAFTPNGDGRNDFFYPVLFSTYQTVIDFRIYNRWGQQVHGDATPWNGKIENKDQPAGTYAYYLIVRTPDIDHPGTTKDVKLQGAFSLLR